MKYSHGERNKLVSTLQKWGAWNSACCYFCLRNCCRCVLKRAAPRINGNEAHKRQWEKISGNPSDRTSTILSLKLLLIAVNERSLLYMLEIAFQAKVTKLLRKIFRLASYLGYLHRRKARPSFPEFFPKKQLDGREVSVPI